MQPWKNCDPDWLKKVSCKKGVFVGNLKPETQLALQVAISVYAFYGKKLTVTSANDGHHMHGSKHGIDQAFDTRIWEIKDNKKIFFDKSTLTGIVTRSQKQLGEDYDVVQEPDHLHFEWDPK